MKQNIVLIGMMGCGKTTVGKRLSEQLNMPFIDTDVLIEETYGPIPKLFERGEDYFRDAESKIISEIASFEGAVISTGGGVVLREENVKALKEKGFLIFIDRPVDKYEEAFFLQGLNILFPQHNSSTGGNDGALKGCDLGYNLAFSIPKIVLSPLKQLRDRAIGFFYENIGVYERHIELLTQTLSHCRFPASHHTY